MKIKNLFIFIFPLSVFSQPSIAWFEDFNGSGEESIGHYVLSCEDNGFLQIGETYDYSSSSSKILVIKIDSNGQMIWNREISIGNHNLGNSAIELNDGYLICGGLNQNSALIKLEKQTGATLFIETFNNGGTDAFEHATITPNGIVAVGYIHSEDPYNTFYTEGQGYIMFFDDTANEIFSQNLSEYIDQAYRIKYINNELIISGLSEEASDYKLIKMSLDGDIIWHQIYGGDSEDHCFAMDVNDNGDIFLAGHTVSGTVNWDTYTIKINNDGDLIWEQIVGNPRGFDPEYIHDEAWGIKATNDGGCVTIAGTGDEYDNYSEWDGNQCSDIWNAYLIKFDNEGVIEWETTFASLDISNDNYDWAGEAIDLTDDGGAIIAIDNGQFGFLRIDNIQNVLTTDIDLTKPQTFILHNNYPNPFNPSTTLSYELQYRKYIKLVIYDVKGNSIKSLINKDQAPGEYSIVWSGKDLQEISVPSGVYFYALDVEGRINKGKMVLLK